MYINSDINVLGSLKDWNLTKVFLSENMVSMKENGGIHAYTNIKTDKSVKRFEKVIRNTILTNQNIHLEHIVKQYILGSKSYSDKFMVMFWNASANNELFFYLNENVYFPAFYSGRVSLKNDEVVACIMELKQTEDSLKTWSDSTITTTASKYLTLLKKFGLMEGSMNKTIVHPYLSDEMFVLFVYWISAILDKQNLIDKPWLLYSLCEKQVFLDRLFQKKFSKYYNVVYSGDKLNIETLIPYESIYEYNNKS